MKRVDADTGKRDIFTATCAPVPEFVSCPNCGMDMEFWEFWTAGDNLSCFFCGKTLSSFDSTVH